MISDSQMKFSTICFYLFLSVTLSSCYFNNRLIYLQGSRSTPTTAALLPNKRITYHLQPADVISVRIKGSTDNESSNSIFNLAADQNMAFTSPSSLFLEGYTIDSKGKIILPIIGEVVVKDLTIEEVQQLIQTHANKFLNKATVIVKLTSFKVTVLGEVKNPGYLYVYNNQATILEVLGLAGDLTQFANRKNIKLIRQVPAGSQVALLDLTDSRLISSDYFYLQPNDVIYVEPLKARSNKANLEVLSVIFAGLTTIVLILSYINQQ
jgi:polysaccharide export outer membrane protein